MEALIVVVLIWIVIKWIGGDGDDGGYIDGGAGTIQ